MSLQAELADEADVPVKPAPVPPAEPTPPPPPPQPMAVEPPSSVAPPQLMEVCSSAVFFSLQHST